MKILQLCHKPPRPSVDGGCIAMDNITTGLLDAGHEVKVLTASTHKHPFRPEKIDKEYLDKCRLENCFIDTRVNLIDAFSNLVTNDSYNVSRFFSPDLDMALERILRNEKFDIVHLESLFMTPYVGTVKRFSDAPVLLRSHNLEYMIWERIAAGTRFGAKRWYIKHLAKRLKNYEKHTLNDIDGVIAITEEDRKKYLDLGCDKPIITLPFGIDEQKYGVNGEMAEEFSVFHLGSMDWRPNLEGVEWFLQKVWPRAREIEPRIKLYLAGRDMPEEILNLDQPGVTVIGEVENAYDFIRSKQVMFVPLRSAGGMRIKIIEGMALGRAIVTTSIGAEGIPAKSGVDMLCADDPDQFAEAISQLASNPEESREMGKRARNFVLSNFSTGQLTQKLTDFYRQFTAVG